MTALVDLSNPAQLREKEDKLFAILKAMERVIVAFSGGTDSAYLAWAAGQALGENALAITADSASMPESHKRAAEEFVRQFGIRHEYIVTHEFDNPDYVKNSADRCFHCKDELFTRLEEIGRGRGTVRIVYGVNVDDLGDYRPGQNAARKHDVNAPLVDAGLTKAEIRELSRLAGLPTWDRPASACLSSRIPYGTPVTIENVKTVENGEEAIKALGLPAVPRALSRRGGAHRNRPRRNGPRPHPGDGRAVHGDLQEARLQVRDARSGRLPPGLHERGLEPAEVKRRRPVI